MNDRRLRPAVVAVGALLAVGAVVAVLVVARAVINREPPVIGTTLDGRPAPDFTLTDHRGRPVRLSDLRGKAVVLTFIYTNCPDVCPLTAETLRSAHELLPARVRDRVALMAVSLDPTRDTPAALREFTTKHRLAGNPNWYALGGDPAALARVWAAYGVFPGTLAATPGAGASRGTRDGAIAGGGEGHTDATYLIDPQGRERVFVRSGVAPTALAENLEALVG